MGNVKIINNSTLTESAAVLSVGMYMSGAETAEERSTRGIMIKQKGMTFIISDIQQRFCRYWPQSIPENCKGCKEGCLDRKPAAYINREFEEAVKEMEKTWDFSRN